LFSNNIRPHMVCASMNRLCHVKVLQRSARSSHLSQIQHVWDKLGRQL
uniref:Uncharacterized protein n=1 Tax=Kryptolebias marmoratus TaxID=37003 RepID=A0A3Q3FUY9_KRYMA